MMLIDDLRPAAPGRSFQETKATKQDNVQPPQEKSDPMSLGESLLAEFIREARHDARFRLTETWESSAGFDEKVHLYKLALVLSALLAIEQKNPTFKNVRDHLEKLVFSPDIADAHCGIFFFNSVKQAMDGSRDLYSSKMSGQTMNGYVLA